MADIQDGQQYDRWSKIAIKSPIHGNWNLVLQEFFVMDSIVSDLAILCRLGL